MTLLPELLIPSERMAIIPIRCLPGGTYSSRSCPAMAITELLPKIHELPRADKLRVLCFLTSELSADEGPSLVPGGEYPVWSPLGAESAAADLLSVLDQAKGDQI